MIKGNKIFKDNLLLTYVGYFISHHVFIMVDSGVGNIRLVSRRHNVQFLKQNDEGRRTLSGEVTCLQTMLLLHHVPYYLDADTHVRAVQ